MAVVVAQDHVEDRVAEWVGQLGHVVRKAQECDWIGLFKVKSEESWDLDGEDTINADDDHVSKDGAHNEVKRIDLSLTVVKDRFSDEVRDNRVLKEKVKFWKHNYSR